MKFLERRSFLLNLSALVLAPRNLLAAPPRIALTGAMKEGGLVIGRTEPGASVTLDGKKLRVSADGRFAFGFPYDQKTPSLLEAVFADGGSEKKELAPALRTYDIQRINGLPQNYVSPPPDIAARIREETETNNRQRMRDTDVDWYADGFDWPASGILSSIYGSQRILNGAPELPHLAVDIAAPTGTPIHAPADAIVAHTADQYLNGGFTLLDHGHGVSTYYLHQSKRLVAIGDKVTRGQVIGELGQTGRATGPNLHWGLNWFLVALDPSLATPTPKPPPL